MKKYWVATGDFKREAMIKVLSVSTHGVLIDFSTRAERSVTVVHAEDGTLNLQAGQLNACTVTGRSGEYGMNFECLFLCFRVLIAKEKDNGVG